MSSPSSPPPWPQRLSVQLQTLSHISEALTLRLLELEERLAGCESLVHRLDDGVAAGGEGPSIALELLEQTDRRIARLESLLARDSALLHPPPAAQPRLQVLHAQPVPAAESPERSGLAHDGLPLGADPFPEEGEQPFMDELTA